MFDGPVPRCIVYGATESGKSTLLRFLQYGAPDEYTVWIVDPLDEHIVLEDENHGRFTLDDEADIDADGPAFELYDEACRRAYKRGNVLLLGDEFNMAHRKVGDKYLPGKHVVKVVLQGRKRKVGYVWFTQIPSQISRVSSSMCNEWIVFVNTEPPVLDWLTRLGFDRATVASLPQGACLHKRARDIEPHLHMGPLRGRCVRTHLRLVKPENNNQQGA